ncbi:hypothetical protein [Hydrogenobacter hydrogenophilus]|uniref:hypothetical protein n=1 Tax=Hydrogenobacter hydrogenophilus TaxID=35835 RepID=UPI001FECF425|nr:hypothetical protein [Hydrogenobacter hydrogenophilus]
MRLFLLVLSLIGFSLADEVESIMKKDVFPSLSKSTKGQQKEIVGYVKVGHKGYVFYEDGGKLKREPFHSILDIRKGKMYIREDGKVKVEEFKFSRRSSADKQQPQIPKNIPPLKELLEGNQSK